MNDKIFIIEENGMSELEESEFGNELEFQLLLEKYPDLISGNQINPDNPRKWLLIDREFGVPEDDAGRLKWSIDHLFIDQDGIPTLVEVKRSTDTRIRREVVGQMLDYAANALAYWSIETIKNKYYEYCQNNKIDAEEQIINFAENINDINEFWEKVRRNLEYGKIRMLFVADKLPKELIRIIEFLNSQMAVAEVLGLELKYFENNKIQTLVPKVVGNTSIAENRKGKTNSERWTEEKFLKELEDRTSKENATTINKILAFAKEMGLRIWYGQGVKTGSLYPVFDYKSIPFELFSVYTYGKIEIQFQYLKDKPIFKDEEERLELLKKYNHIGLELPYDKIDKRPSFNIDKLNKDNKLSDFLEVFEWFIKVIKEKV